MTLLVKSLIVFFLLLILLNIIHKLFGVSFGLFSIVEGNKGFEKYEEDPVTMSNEQKTKIADLKKRVDKMKNYHDQFKKIEISNDEHTQAVEDLK